MVRYVRINHLFPLLAVIAISASLGAVERPLKNIENYRVLRKNCREISSGKTVRAFRKFERDREKQLLIADVKTLETRVVSPETLNCDDSTADTEANQSKLQLALDQSVKEPFTLSNDGIQHASTPVQGTFLTADLCPSLHGQFEYRFFDELEKIATRTGTPTPIALAVSGGWINHHGRELEEILRLQSTHKISVTWVNHSNSHPYFPHKEDSDNFLLVPSVNPEREIQGVEIKLLERGLVPSIFFRFPGLISNESWIRTLNRYSLISLGSNAWLAKNERAKPGSIILVHANGNEVLGISKFLKQLPQIESIGPFLPLSKAL